MRLIITSLSAIGIIPKFALGISFGLSLGGSKGSSSSVSNTELEETKTTEESKSGIDSSVSKERTDQTSTGSTAADSTSTSSGVETSTLSLLDDDTKNLVSNLMNSIAAGDDGNQELLSLLETRALGSDAAFADIVDPQVAEARRLQEQDLGQSVQALSRATGGGAGSNSLVAGFDLEGQRAIDSAIASLGATLGIEGRKAATEEITSAFEAGVVGDQAQSSAVAQLGEVLKGATQTGSKAVESTEKVTSTEEVMQALASATSTGEIRTIVENLFSTENLVGTEKTVGSGSSKEKSAGFSLGF